MRSNEMKHSSEKNILHVNSLYREFVTLMRKILRTTLTHAVGTDSRRPHTSFVMHTRINTLSHMQWIIWNEWMCSRCILLRIANIKRCAQWCTCTNNAFKRLHCWKRSLLLSVALRAFLFISSSFPLPMWLVWNVQRVCSFFERIFGQKTKVKRKWYLDNWLAPMERTGLNSTASLTFKVINFEKCTLPSLGKSAFSFATKSFNDKITVELRHCW